MIILYTQSMHLCVVAFIEHLDDSGQQFHVTIIHPLVSLMVVYYLCTLRNVSRIKQKEHVALSYIHSTFLRLSIPMHFDERGSMVSIDI